MSGRCPYDFRETSLFYSDKVYFKGMKKEPWTDDRSMEGRLEIRLDPELKKDLNDYAKKIKIRVSAVARNAIVEYLEKKNREVKRQK